MENGENGQNGEIEQNPDMDCPENTDEDNGNVDVRISHKNSNFTLF